MINIDPLLDFQEKTAEYFYVSEYIEKLDLLMGSREQVNPVAFNMRATSLLNLIKTRYPEYQDGESPSMEGIGDTIMEVLEAIWKQIQRVLEWLKKKAVAIWALLLSIFSKNKEMINNQLNVIKDISTDENYLSALEKVLLDRGLVFGTKVDTKTIKLLKEELVKVLGEGGFDSFNAYILVNKTNELINPVDASANALLLAPIKVLKDEGVRQAITTVDSTPSTNVPEDLERLYTGDKRWSGYIVTMIDSLNIYLKNIRSGYDAGKVDKDNVAFSALVGDLLKKGDQYFGRMGLGNSCIAVKDINGVAVISHSRSNKKISESAGKPSKRVGAIPLIHFDRLYIQLSTILNESNTLQANISDQLESLGKTISSLKEDTTLGDEAKRNLLNATRAYKELIDSNIRRTRDFGNLYGMLEKLLVGVVGEPTIQ